jgi:RND family efflux transporter MFP subunit
MASDHNDGNHQTTRTVTRQELGRRPPPAPKQKRSFLWLYLLIALGVIAALIVLVLFRRSQAQETLKENTQQNAEPTVLVVRPQPGDTERHIVLPGTVEALMESSVYAQVSGYIKRWLVDIGGAVKEGDLLAEIETPVTDQQLKQAAESVKQAQANLNLAKVTAARYNELFKTHAVAQQDVDNQNANVQVQAANLDAAIAFQSGIEQTEKFKQVRAPFDGVVTARRIDVGDFVSATGQTAAASGSAPLQTGTPNQELFRIAQTHTLRVYVNVPERNADEIVPGISATLDMASAPNEKVTGKLVRTADAIDPSSLTLLSEVDVDNESGKLLPGGYAQVHFDITTKHPPLVVPGNTLIFRAQGPQVGVVDESGKVHLKSIKIERDLGTKLEISEGIEENDQIILNPSDSLADGNQVKIDTSQQQKQP